MSFSGIDETLTCNLCNLQFIFSIGEQNFFTTMDYDAPPKKCKECRAKKRERNSGVSGYNSTGGYTSGPAAQPAAPATSPVPDKRYAPIDRSPAPRDDDMPRRRKKSRRSRDDDGYDY